MMNDFLAQHAGRTMKKLERSLRVEACAAA
jgi:hypothetical protein